ncbi:MAG: tRNA (cytidine(34)-2'-O)-methyltransferase [Clostridia bacterium]
MSLNIVLVEPKIPQNTGNIARTCAAIGATLHLVYPLGFSIDEKQVKRAGLDYWDKLNIIEYKSLDEFKSRVNTNINLVTTKSKYVYTDVKYNEDSYLIFGSETKGLNEDYLKENFESTIRIPMSKNIRSLNLSNSVAIVAYEALRQLQFNDLEKSSKYFEEKI